MAISPISSVSFKNNYNQVNFEGKKDKAQNSSVVSNTIKAIPLATLIAMSPLNTVNAQLVSGSEKVVGFKNFDKTKDGVNEGTLFYISNDGNDDDAEILRYTTTKCINYGVKETVKKCHSKISDVGGLLTVNVISNDGKSTEYYVTGSGSNIFDNGRGNKRISKQPSQQILISREAYDFLKDIYGDNIEYKTKTEDRRSNDDDDDDDDLDF